MARPMITFLVLVLLTAGLAADATAGLRIGGGIHYLRTVGELKDSPGFDKNSTAFLGVAKYSIPLFRVEGDLEIVPDYVGSDKTMWQPQAYVFIGGLLYGGIGTGVGYLGDFGWQDPFFALRLGVDITVGAIDLDVFGSYRFQKADDLSHLGQDDLDSITLGALLSFELGSD